MRSCHNKRLSPSWGSFMRALAVCGAMMLPTHAMAAQEQNHEGHDHQDEARQPAQRGGGPTHNQEPQPFKMKSPIIDIGAVRPGTPTEVEIELFNASERPVPVTRISTTCTCVSNESDLPKVIQSGEVGVFSVTFKGRPNPGIVEERVTIWYETPSGRQQAIAVPIKGEIAFPVKSDPFYVNLLLQDRSGQLTLSSTDSVPFKVLSAGGQAPVFAQGAQAGAEARSEHVITYDFTDVPDAEVPNFYVIQTTHPESPLLDLRVIHKGLITQASRSAWSVSQDRFPLGRMSDGQSNDVTVTIVGMSAEDDVPTVTSSHPMIHAEVVEERDSDRKGRTFAIRFTIEGEDESLLVEKITLASGAISREFDVFVWTNPSE
ncbi:MAG: DUF1573 domain-containing protein [Phycisphaerales bacterium JB043]